MCALFSPNPQAVTKPEFECVRPGVYRMRIVEITPYVSKSGANWNKARLEFVDKGQCVKLDGTLAKNPGNVFDPLLSTNQDNQGQLRQLVESCGKEWGTVNDLDELKGCEVDVKLSHVPEGKFKEKNEVKRYLMVK